MPPCRLRATLTAGAALALRASGADAQAPRPDAPARVVDTVRVIGRIDDLIGTAASASEGRIGAVDLRARPITREGELLETVPGVIVTQHSGDGKANQYFVRGFNLDHGTDFQTRLEGMPLNMPTHGHGQGYTDLNLIIPELVDYLDYKLGVHHAELGDFGSAGGAEFHLVRSLDAPFASTEYGANGLARLAAGGSRTVGAGTLLLGGEAKTYDGPWERSQDVRKLAGVARYSWARGSSRVSVLGMAYRNRWNATDQIPRRAVAQGRISRFGTLDSTDGGNAARYSLSGSWRRVGGRSVQDVQLYGIHSDLRLYSNFAYFLSDEARGDQFAQWDRRTVLGGSATHAQAVELVGVSHELRTGVQLRGDLIGGLGLAQTVARQRVQTVREDRVRQTGAGVFVEAQSHWRPWFRSVLGLRADGYAFDVRSDRAENSGDRTAGIVSPKASLVLSPTRTTELYVSGGYGFHSNDARGTTIRVDPVSGEAAPRVDPLVRSRGGELGLRTTPTATLRTTVSLWTLGLDSELLFVGDAGATEPSAGSRRSGVTVANFYRPLPSLSLDLDLSVARARFRDVPTDAAHIPGALEQVVAGGVSWLPTDRGPFGAVRARHFGAYPLLEDNSVRATGSTLLNADVGYLLPSGLRLQLTVLNLTDSRVDDIQYHYASRLAGEPTGGVEDVHFHPAEPRQLRASIGWRF
jgi:hypothetical protein